MDTAITNDITDLEILELNKPKFIRPFLMKFKRDGVPHSWECVKAISSVSVLLYHEQKDAFLLVKQFRPAVWYSQQSEGIKTNEAGFTYELCAGLLDKGLSCEQTIREEAIEEVGYKLKDIRRITSTYGAFGFSGNLQTMFFANIDESMRVSSGGGVDGEDIKLVFIPREKALEFIYDESKPKDFGLLFAITWFLQNFKR